MYQSAYEVTARGGAVGWGSALQGRRWWVQFPVESLGFLIFLPHYGPGVDSTSDINEYQVYLLGVEAAGA
jgi:hypothetical protein